MELRLGRLVIATGSSVHCGDSVDVSHSGPLWDSGWLQERNRHDLAIARDAPLEAADRVQRPSGRNWVRTVTATPEWSESLIPSEASPSHAAQSAPHMTASTGAAAHT